MALEQKTRTQMPKPEKTKYDAQEEAAEELREEFQEKTIEPEAAPEAFNASRQRSSRLVKSQARVLGPVALVAAILALLMGRGAGFGLLGTGQTGEVSGSRGVEENASAEAEAPVETPEVTEAVTENVTEAVTESALESTLGTAEAEGLAPDSWNIEVRGTELFVNDSKMGMEELEELLKTAESDSQFVLKDSHGIKSSYDSVKQLLEEMDVSFLEENP